MRQVLLLLLPLLVARATAQAAVNYTLLGSPQLRFVAQLSVNGCTLFVHDTGASDGPHLAVEPLMCVTRSSLENVLPRFDAVTQQAYVSVPVLLRDDAVLEEVRRRLSHLAPKSVSFATVSDVNVVINASLGVQALDFVWDRDESVGFLRLGCSSNSDNCSCAVASSLRNSEVDALHQFVLNAFISFNGSFQRFKYPLLIQNSSLYALSIASTRYKDPPICRQLKYVRKVYLENCTVRVHQRMDMKGHFLMEPLLCHDMSSLSSESVLFDYSSDMYYLKLGVLLQDEDAVDAVRTQLADLEPRSVSFMRLWRARSEVSDALIARFEVGELLVSGDGTNAQLSVFSRTRANCISLRNEIIAEPVNLWRHIQWKLTSLLSSQCVLHSEGMRHSIRILETSKTRDNLVNLCPAYDIRDSGDNTRPIRVYVRKEAPDRRRFRIIQQRIHGFVSIERTWAEYERGFGDKNDFWIGLSAIHSLTVHGTTLRVEMTLWNGSALFAEYSGFRVGNSETNYTMTYDRRIRSSPSIDTANGLGYHKGRQFSTKDRDNDESDGSCSQTYGNGGWWFGHCHRVNPNGFFPFKEETDNWAFMCWDSNRSHISIRQVRMMVQVS